MQDWSQVDFSRFKVRNPGSERARKKREDELERERIRASGALPGLREKVASIGQNFVGEAQNIVAGVPATAAARVLEFATTQSHQAVATPEAESVPLGTKHGARIVAPTGRMVQEAAPRPEWAENAIGVLDAYADETNETSMRGDPRLEGSLLYDAVPRGLASVAAIAASGGAAGAIGAPAELVGATGGALMEASGTYLEAKTRLAAKVARGEITPEQARQRAWSAWALGLPLGAADQISVGGIMDRVDKAMGGLLGDAATKIALGAAGEFAQEAGQGVGENVVQRWVTGDDVALLENVKEQGLAGGIVGGALAAMLGLGHAIGNRRAQEAGQVPRGTPGAPTEQAPALPQEAVQAPGQPVAAEPGPAPDLVPGVGLAGTERVGQAAQVEIPPEVRAMAQQDPTVQRFVQNLAKVGEHRGRPLSPEQASELLLSATPLRGVAGDLARAFGAQAFSVGQKGVPLELEGQYLPETRTVVLDASLDEKTAARQVIAHELWGHHGRAIAEQEWTSIRDQLEADFPDLMDQWRVEQEGIQKSAGVETSPDLVREESVAQAAEEAAGFTVWALSNRSRLETLLTQARKGDRPTFMQRLLDLFRKAFHAVGIGKGTAQQQLDLLARTVSAGQWESMNPRQAAELAGRFVKLADAMVAQASKGPTQVPTSPTQAAEAPSSPVRERRQAAQPVAQERRQRPYSYAQALSEDVAAGRAETEAAVSQMEREAEGLPEEITGGTFEEPGVAAMPTEAGLFGPVERESKAPQEAAGPAATQLNLLDVQEGDLPGQTSILDEPKGAPIPEEIQKAAETMKRRRSTKALRFLDALRVVTGTPAEAEIQLEQVPIAQLRKALYTADPNGPRIRSGVDLRRRASEFLQRAYLDTADALEAKPERQAAPPKAPEPTAGPGLVEAMQREKVSPETALLLASEDPLRNLKGAERSAQLERVPVSKLKLAPKEFQYKGRTEVGTGLDPEGPLAKLKTAEEFSEVSAGAVLAYRRQSGELVVVDGHQRTNAAKRLGVPELNAYVLEESDGVTPLMARNVGALLNMRAERGRAVDAAQVLRDLGLGRKELRSLGLVAANRMFAQAEGLAELTDPVFSQVLSEALPEAYGAAIGRAIPREQGQRQTKAAEMIRRTAQSEEQADSIARQVAQTDLVEMGQSNLFGEGDTKTLIELRSELERPLLAELKRNRGFFNRLARLSGLAETAGETSVDVEAAGSRARGAEQILELIQRFADRRGTVVNRILNDAAARIGPPHSEKPAALAREVAERLAALDWDNPAALEATDLGPATPTRQSSGPTLFSPGGQEGVGSEDRFRPADAFHGTPYEFEQFSTEHIGSGEGAQAYGWGLYFAGKKEVADYYRKSIAQPTWMLDGQRLNSGAQLTPFGRENHSRLAMALMDIQAPDTENPKAAVHKEAAELRDHAKFARKAYGDEVASMYEDKAARLEEYADRLTVKHGTTYKVQLAPDDDEWLLWDEPLSKQNEKVKAALEAAHERGDLAVWPRGHSGGDWYHLRAESIGPRRLSALLRSVGIRGIKYLDGGSRTRGEGSYNYVVFDAGDIKIQERFSPAEDEPAVGPHALGGSFADREETFWQRLNRRVMYEFAPVARAQAGVLAEGGTVTPESDVAKKQTLYESKRAEDVRAIRQEQRKLVRLLKRAKIKLDEFDDYLRALHAPRRNDLMAERHPGAFNPLYNPGAGSTTRGARLTPNVIRDILSTVEADPRAAAFRQGAALVHAVNEAALQQRVDQGLLSREGAETWREQFGPEYVPLRSAELESQDGLPFVQGAGFQVPKRLSKRAEGRRTASGSPTVWSFAQAEEVASWARRNEVGRAMASLVRANPIPGLWRVSDTPTTQDGKPVEASDGKVQAFRFKERGDDRYIVFEGPTGVQLAETLKRLGVEKTGSLVKYLGGVGRVFTRLATQWNPEFLLRNLVKDVPTALIRTVAVQGWKAGARTGASIPMAIRGIRQVLQAETAGKEPPHGYWQDRFVEFRRAGGKTGYTSLQDYQSRAEDFGKALERGNVAELARTVWAAYENLQEAVEAGTRLAVYDTSLRHGMSQEDAAVQAREVTVDFNRKGELTPVLNSLYWFFNPSVQGSRMVLKTLGTPRGAALGGAVAALGYILANFNRWIGQDDDDKRNRWDETSDWLKNGYLQVLLPGMVDVPLPGGRKLSIDRVMAPLPWGYSMLFSAGLHAAEVQARAEDPAAALGHVMAAATESFNPMGASPTPAQFVSPSLIDPFVQLTENRSFTGSAIRPENPYGQKAPSEVYWPDVNESARELTHWLNQITGGNKREAGRVSISPEDLEHLVQSYTGGGGQFLERAFKAAQNIAAGGEVETREVPFLRSFAAEPDDRTMQSQYRRAVNRVRTTDQVQRLDQGAPQRPELLELVEIAKEYAKEVEDLEEAGLTEQANARRREFLKLYRSTLNQEPVR